MKNIFAIILLLLPFGVRAQWDTVHAPVLKPHYAPLVGATLYSAGALITLRHELHDYEIDLYDNLDIVSNHKLHFDDYLQFAPAAAPFVLNLCGVRGEHNFGQLSLLSACSFLIGMTAIETGKIIFKTERPDHSASTSFPSGHTCAAFTGAEIMRREYGKRYPWMTYASYGVAVLVAIMRMYNNRHWPSDVIGGAGLAILSVSASYALFGQ